MKTLHFFRFLAACCAPPPKIEKNDLKNCNQIETNKNGFNMVKKGFNMVLEGFIAFGWLKKPRFLMIRAGWPLPKIKIPTGWNLPKKKSAFFFFSNITMSNSISETILQPN